MLDFRTPESIEQLLADLEALGGPRLREWVELAGPTHGQIQTAISTGFMPMFEGQAEWNEYERGEA